MTWLWLGREVEKVLGLRSVREGPPLAASQPAEPERLEGGSSVTEESQPGGGGASGAGEP